ncbi:hypothetical protein [Desulfosporosinus metallidurans]|uniref:Tim44-like domain-containing protein n=1 Tax=Desulfosporosinus metallidurans TaxID=1888891 RepID=A0A1Q8QWS1_9FIRM|nr:hypothetical protein [Desulfosporosinus metallidurans]OLN31794.1 hypothetical protein DSOL_2290 [Desulfosporosinus metallidurans]
MRKMNYFVGALALALGVLVGTLGMSLLTNSSSPASFISKLRGQDKVQTVSGMQTPSILNTVPDSLSTSNPVGPEKDVLSLGQNGSNKDTAALSQLKQQVITDYKQDIGIFFGAWKSTDMENFRLKLAKAYTGDLFEKHARRAEEYLVQGIGLDVSQITFDRVDVESANENTATLRADYHYTARDYNLADAATVGEEHEQTVHARVNLLKLNSRWMITGESPIQ